MNGRRGLLGSTSMALTRESFCRYASSTCQRTSSDREPTLRSSKFWGGRRLASRLCKASYKFVCCGRDRAWCSLGLPIYTLGQPGCWLFTVTLRAASRRCAKATDSNCWLSVAALPRQALPAGCALPEQLFGCGLCASTRCAESSCDFYRGYSDAFWGDCHCPLVSGCLKFTPAEHPTARDGTRQGQHS